MVNVQIFDNHDSSQRIYDIFPWQLQKFDF